MSSSGPSYGHGVELRSPGANGGLTSVLIAALLLSAPIHNVSIDASRTNVNVGIVKPAHSDYCNALCSLTIRTGAVLLGIEPFGELGSSTDTESTVETNCTPIGCDRDAKEFARALGLSPRP